MFKPGIYIIDPDKNYVARTDSFQGISQYNQWVTVKLIDGRVMFNGDYTIDMGVLYCLSFAPLVIVGHLGFETNTWQHEPRVLKCKEMAECMAVFRIEGDGDRAIWFRVRSFYIGL